jgi:hypothetical protein
MLANALTKEVNWIETEEKNTVENETVHTPGKRLRIYVCRRLRLNLPIPVTAHSKA